MKYIDANKLKTGITKERKNIEGMFVEGDNTFWDGQDDAYCYTLALIDSLQQEQQEVDLEKEIDKTVNECTDGYNFDWDKFALHFYELGKNSK